MPNSEKISSPACCGPAVNKKSGFLSGLFYGLLPHTFLYSVYRFFHYRRHGRQPVYKKISFTTLLLSDPDRAVNRLRYFISLVLFKARRTLNFSRHKKQLEIS